MFDQFDSDTVAAFDRYLHCFFPGPPSNDPLCIDPGLLEQSLIGEGITPLRVGAFVRQLEADKILIWRTHTIPAGRSPRGLIGGIPVWEFRSEPEVSTWLETTWELWELGKQLLSAARSVAPGTRAEPLPNPASGEGGQEGTEGGDRPAGIGVAAPKSNGLPLDEANVKVRNWLAANATRPGVKATRDAIAAATGVSKGQVSKTLAWIAYRDRRDAESRPGERTVSLSDEMLASVPAGCDRPNKLDALIESQAEDMRREESRPKRRQKRRHDG